MFDSAQKSIESDAKPQYETRRSAAQNAADSAERENLPKDGKDHGAGGRPDCPQHADLTSALLDSDQHYGHNQDYGCDDDHRTTGRYKP